MKVLDDGHKYLLDDNKSNTQTNTLIFFKDKEINGDGYNGTTNQEVIRSLIDRVKFLHNQVPSDYNDKIIFHLRKALILHEQRHLDREIEKNKPVENIIPFDSGHFIPKLGQ